MTDILAKLTKAGMDLIHEANADAGKTIKLRHMRIGSHPHGMSSDKDEVIKKPVGAPAKINQVLKFKDAEGNPIHRYIADFSDAIPAGADIHEIGVYAADPADPNKEVLYAFIASEQKLTTRYERENLVIRFQLKYVNLSDTGRVVFESQGEVADWEIYSNYYNELQELKKNFDAFKQKIDGYFGTVRGHGATEQKPPQTPPLDRYARPKGVFDRLWALERKSDGNIAIYPTVGEMPPDYNEE